MAAPGEMEFENFKQEKGHSVDVQNGLGVVDSEGPDPDASWGLSEAKISEISEPPICVNQHPLIKGLEEDVDT